MASPAARYVGGVRDVLSGRRHIYYGWRVLAVGTLAMALGGGLSQASFGFYVHPLEDEFGWSRAEVSLGFSAAVLSGGLTAPLVGRWVDAHGARSCIVLGGALAALSYVLLAATQELWQFYLFWALHAVCRQMMFFLPFQALISHWFQRRRGIALSILGSGFSLGAFLVLPMVAIAIGGLGWRGAYLFSGACVGLFFVPAGLFVVRNRPEDVGEHVDGDPAPERTADGRRRDASTEGMTLREAARLPLFWLCAFGFMLLFFGMMGWQVHQVPFYESHGMSRATATTIVSVSAAVAIVARLAMGAIADRFERFETVVVFLLGLLATAMATLLISTSPIAIAVFVACWVVGASMGPMVESLVLIRAFGLKHFGSILGAMLVIETMGQIISPSVAGAIYDGSGSYDGALVMFMCAFLVGMALFVVASRLKEPVRERLASAAA
jgi:sugar phosphate permease